jgi:hypothetical protein
LISAFEVVDIGKIAANAGKHFFAARWLNAALEIIAKEGKNPTIAPRDMIAKLAPSVLEVAVL